MRIWTVIAMMLMWMVPLVLLAWLVLSAASNKQLVTHGCGPALPVAYDPALEIVRERYARGEIDRATYEQLVAGLFGRS